VLGEPEKGPWRQGGAPGVETGRGKEGASREGRGSRRPGARMALLPPDYRDITLSPYATMIISPLVRNPWASYFKYFKYFNYIRWS